MGGPLRLHAGGLGPVTVRGAAYADRVHVVVVGGGVAGLSAAAEAGRRGARVTVLEASSRVGGKVAVSQVGGLPVDEGADSMLTRVPDGLALARSAGLEGELVAPAAAQASVLSLIHI